MMLLLFHCKGNYPINIGHVINALPVKSTIGPFVGHEVWGMRCGAGVGHGEWGKMHIVDSMPEVFGRISNENICLKHCSVNITASINEVDFTYFWVPLFSRTVI